MRDGIDLTRNRKDKPYSLSPNSCLIHGRRLSLDQSLAILTNICEAMYYSHREGVIHRDLKPGNILLDCAGRAYVYDFGMAKSLGSELTDLTRSNEVMGTMAYLAPEQRMNTRSVDLKADILAMGAVFYEMLMGFPSLGRFTWPVELRSGS